MGELGGLLSMGSHRVGHDLSNLAAAASTLCTAMKLKVKAAQSCPTLGNPMGCIVHGILQKGLLLFPCYFRPSQVHTPTAAAAAAAQSLQSCLTLCDPMDCSPPGSLIPGILQARTLEWVAIAFSNA